MGLKSYNNYLKFQIGREITKFDKIILTVLGDSKENMSCTIHEIDQKLQSDDRLELLRYLTTKIGIERIDFVETRDIDKIKEWGPIILPPIAIVVGLLSIFWK